jgi:heme-degrading monooxygenase HmoA/ketosteroid isomerase-like protein
MHDNKLVVRTLWEQGISAGRISILAELLAPEYDRAALEKSIAELHEGFPDIHYTVEDLVGDGDHVAVRWTWTGTHTHQFRAFPATGTAVRDSGFAICTMRDGRVTHIAMQTDRLGFLQQIGLVPTTIGPHLANVVDTRRAPTAVYLIDTFRVPAAAREEFDVATQRNRAFIRTLPGFRGDAMFHGQRAVGSSTGFDVVTIAVWESREAIAAAKDKVAAYYADIGFDLAALLARTGITLERTICSAPVELQR